MILITGSNGQVGKDLKYILNKKNIKYLALNKKKLNINNENKLIKLIKEKDVNLIINLAAFTKVDEAEIKRKKCLKTNFDSVKNISNICKKNNIFLIHISTDYVFDGTKNKPYNEKDITKPINFYGKSKLKADNYIIKNCNKYVIIRTSWIFSKYKNNFIYFLKNCIKQKKEINLINNQIGNPTSSRSLSVVIMQFIQKYLKKQKILNGVYNFCNYPETTWYNFGHYYIRYILKKNKYPINKIHSEKLNLKANRPSYSSLNSNKINKRLKIKKVLWKSELKNI